MMMRAVGPDPTAVIIGEGDRASSCVLRSKSDHPSDSICSEVGQVQLVSKPRDRNHGIGVRVREPDARRMRLPTKQMGDTEVTCGSDVPDVNGQDWHRRGRTHASRIVPTFITDDHRPYGDGNHIRGLGQGLKTTCDSRLLVCALEQRRSSVGYVVSPVWHARALSDRAGVMAPDVEAQIFLSMVHKMAKGGPARSLTQRVVDLVA